MLKFITRFLRPLGMFVIFVFAALCIFGSIFVRDIDPSAPLGKVLYYTVSFENRFYDFRLKNSIEPRFKSKDIVLVKIDDYSLEKIGTWPIPRTEHAKLIDKLRAFGAKVVALDILFPEKSPNIGDVSPDAILAESYKNFQDNGGRIFISYTLTKNPAESLPEAPVEMLNDVLQTQSVASSNLEPMQINKNNFPIQELLDSQVGLGSITAMEDPDGIFRHYQMIANVDEIYYGSLGFNAFEAFSEKKHLIKIFQDNSAELDIDGKKMEISSMGEIKIRFVGGDEQFPSASMYDVLSSEDDDPKMKSLFGNKIVFVGSTALGAHDLRPSPIDSKMPGVYAHMNMAHMLIHKYFYKNNNESVKFSLLFLFVGMLIFLVVQRLGNPFLDAGTVILTVIACYAADTNYFLPAGHEMKLFYCFFCFLASYSWNTFLKFYEANKEKKQIRGTFARYVAPTIVDEMLKDPDKLHVGGTKMDITCLFSDVRDFTKISEGLSATELAHSLNIYMGTMTDIVFDTKGTLDKYIGDAIVALWGAPLPVGNHAQYAVEAAIEMMKALPAINEEFRKLGRPEFNVGIGLNSGECSVGNMGSSRIFSYTALGDNMNLGARLESLCKYYGAQIIISEMTLKRLDLTHIKYRPLDKVVVKGKSKPVEIFEVLHPHHWMTKDPESLDFYLTAYKQFQNKEFKIAYDIFNQLLMANENDKASKRLKEVCRKYLENPETVTENFEVTTMTEK